MLPHWPREPSRPVGVGASISDFEAIATPGGAAYDPNFQAAWSEINTQLNVEGAGQTELNSAKLALTNAFEQLSTQSFGLSGQDAINAAKQYVLVGQTVLGAVQTVGGLVTSLENGAPPLEIMQAFTGTLIGLAAGAGLLSAGVGAAIVASVGAILDILGSLGLFGGAPPPGIPVPGCGYSVSSQPDFQIGCVTAWGPRIEPTSSQWRRFPNPLSTTTNDPVWFMKGVAADGPWPLGGGASAQNVIQLKGPYSADARPIDAAFPPYARVSAEASRGAFQQAFFQSWKSNAEYGLNGLKPQPDEQVLIHTLRLWNRAHSGPMALVQGDYIGSLVHLALNSLSHNDPLVFQGGIGINTGPLKSPPVKVVHLRIPPIKASPTLPSKSSAAVKVAAGTAIVSGAAIVGTVAYSLVKGQAVDAVLGGAWKTMKGWFR